MRDLDKNVVYTTKGISQEKVIELYRWLLKNDKGWEDYSTSDIIDSELLYNKLTEQWIIRHTTDENQISINTLFEVEDKDSLVLVSNDLVDWCVGDVVLEHKGLYYCDIDGVLKPFNYMLKLTEEQKRYLNK